MKILVVGSCGKHKRHHGLDAPTCEEISSGKSIEVLKKQFPDKIAPARDMYTGNQSRELVKGVDRLRSIQGLDVELSIVSAGFGILREEDLVPPYQCTFAGMRIAEILKRSTALSIATDFRSLCEGEFHLIYLALGKDYLIALGDDWTPKEGSTLVKFGGKQHHARVVRLPANRETIKSYSRSGHKIHGIAGFKGDLLRILATFALNQANPLKEVIQWSNPEYFKRVFHKLGGLSYSA